MQTDQLATAGTDCPYLLNWVPSKLLKSGLAQRLSQTGAVIIKSYQNMLRPN